MVAHVRSIGAGIVNWRDSSAIEKGWLRSLFNIRAWAHALQRWSNIKKSRFARNLPFRMTLGRLGIWLAKVGRALQTRYANWNSEFRLQPEFFPNPDYCTLHVSEEVATEPWILTFEGPEAQPKEMTPMVRNLFRVKGVSKVTLQRYEVSIGKGRVYDWKELLPQIEAILLKGLIAQ